MAEEDEGLAPLAAPAPVHDGGAAGVPAARVSGLFRLLPHTLEHKVEI